MIEVHLVQLAMLQSVDLQSNATPELQQSIQLEMLYGSLCVIEH